MVQEKTYKWVQDRLRELHAGTISAEDLKQLDGLAQDDPFIADALEGFRSHPNHPHQELLELLKLKIRPYKLPRRRWLIPNLTVTAVAASLILIIGFWAVVNRISKDEAFAVAEDTSHEVILADETVATNPADAANDGQPTTPESGTQDAAESRRLAKQDETSSDAAPTSPPASATKSITTSRDKEAAIADDEELRSRHEIESAPEPPSAATQSYEKTEDAAIVKDDVRGAVNDPMYFANQIDPDMYARRSAGRVVSKTGEPLIGANLNIRNTNLGTVSDLDGKFELFLPSKESTVDITFSGYETAAVQLRQGEEDVAIHLPELNIEKTTMAMQRQAKATETQQAAAGAATANSDKQQSAFTVYLRSNARFPLKDNLYTPGHNVTLQFDVTNSGEPSQVRIVESSNNKDLDDEALRLIRKGPKWKCEGEKYPCEVRYTIYFQ